MRTRYRNVVQLSQPAVNARCRATVHACNGTLDVQGWYYELYPAIDLKGYIEKIHDSVGVGQSHSVVHRKMTYEKMTSIMGQKPKMESPWGYNTYESDNVPSLETNYYRNRADGVIANWSFSDPLDVDVMPPCWTKVNEPYDERTVTNELYTRARELKADMLLNIAESPGLWPSLRSSANTVRNLSRYWKKIRKVLRSSSDSYLMWKFGISPLISDLTTIAKYSPDMPRQYDLFANGGPFRYTKFIPYTLKFQSAESKRTANGFTVIRDSLQGFSNSPKPGIRYVLVVEPNVPKYYNEAFKKADFILRRFSSSPASFAWERIPFSFVFDWFVDVRGALMEIDKLLGQRPFNVLSYTRSKVYSVTSQTFLDWYSSCNGSYMCGGKASERTFRHYERTVLPGPDLYPGWKGHFGKNQAATTAALISQRLSRLRAK